MPEVPEINERDFSAELIFNATRSSGPGGQHVNKVSTRIELRFDIQASGILLEEEKKALFGKLGKRISKEGILILVSQTERSQSDNKRKAIEKFYKLIEKALAPVKVRRPTRPTATSRVKRLESKHIHSEKKTRRKPEMDY
jgi:ribosome-associated protein